MTDKLDHRLDPMWDKLKADGEKLGFDYEQNPEYDKIRTEVAKEIFEEIEDNWELYREEGSPPHFRFNYNKYKAIQSKYTNKEEYGSH